jgi:hypothetical protein
MFTFYELNILSIRVPKNTSQLFVKIFIRTGKSKCLLLLTGALCIRQTSAKPYNVHQGALCFNSSFCLPPYVPAVITLSEPTGLR